MITRGTTGVNRLRRSDRWTRFNPRVQSLLRSATQPLAVDVGYGASHTTTVEWARWLRQIRPDIEVVGTYDSGDEAVFQAHVQRPDVVVMDVQLADLDGCAAARRLTDRNDDPRRSAVTAPTPGRSSRS